MLAMNYRELVDKIKMALEDKPQNLNGVGQERAHVYAAPSRISSHLPQKPVPLVKIQRKTAIVSKEWNTEVQQTSSVSSQLDSQYLPGADLIPSRVHRWTIKNYATIVKKIKGQKQSKEHEMMAQVSQISSPQEPQQAQEGQKQDELWRDMMKSQEERHYQITRITTFFI